MKRILSLFFMCGIVGWCLWCCGRIHSYSESPEIHFKSLVFEDGTSTLRYAVLTFSFIDGDGDIGVSSQDIDTISRIHYTWEKKMPDRTYVPHQFNNGITTQSAKIPYAEVMNKNEANNKTLKGTIEITIEAPINIQGIDTMRIEFFIVDRAKNNSNVDYTPDFDIQNPPAEPITK